MTDLVPFPSGADLKAAAYVANQVAATEFVPRQLRGKPAAVLAAVLTARELQIGPMQGLQSIHVVDGRPTLSAELMRALVARAGHTIEPKEYGDEKVLLVGRRADNGATAEVAWTLEDAKRAGLLKKQNWVAYPRAMLLARATSELARLLFPDVIAGVSYLPEELGGDEPEPTPFDDSVQASQAMKAVQLPETVDVETGELVDVEDSDELKAAVPISGSPQPAVGEEATGQPNPPTDEPPYAAEQERPNAQDLALRARNVAGPQGWLDLLKDAKAEAQELGVAYPDRASQIDQHVEFRGIVAEKVAQLEANTGPTQQELS